MYSVIMAFEKYSPSGLLAYAIPLYAAPVLAGWSGAPISVIPVFATIFAALILKTRRLPDTVTPLVISALGALLINGLLTGALVGLGWLGAALIGSLAAPLWLSLGLGFFGASLGIWRYRWTPKAEELDQMLDQTLTALTRFEQDTSDRSRTDRDPE